MLTKIKQLLHINDDSSIVDVIDNLIKTEAKFKAVFHSLVEGVSFFDTEGNVDEINDSVTEITGYTRKELTNETRSAIVNIDGDRYPSDNRPGIVALKSGRPIKNVELGMRTKNGEYRWILVNAQPVSVNDKLIGSVSSFIDITDHKKEEEIKNKVQKDLEISERLLRKAQKVAHVASGIWYIKTNKVDWSDEMYTIYGIDKNSFSGTLQEVAESRIHPEDRSRVKEIRRSVLENKKPIPLEHRLCMPDGTIKVVWVEFDEFMFDEEGNPEALFGIVADITERKKIEEDLLLEHSKQQKEILQSLNFFAGGIAHNFNNLFSVIFGYIDLALKESSQSKYFTIQNYLSEAMASMDHAKSLTSHLLSFTESEVHNKEPCNIDQLIINSAKHVLDDDDTIKYHFEFSDDLWICEVNKDQITQVIENVIFNSKQAIEKEGEIYFSAGNILFKEKNQKELLGKFIKIAIRDTGVGMAKETLDHIFEPFFTTKVDRHGIGLTLSYSIVQNHGGVIEAESVLNKGSTFSIYLPALEKV